MVEGISGWFGWMITASSCVSGWLCTKGPNEDVVGTNGCGRGVPSVAGLITSSGLGVVVMALVNGQV